jgi:hypothetical protein
MYQASASRLIVTVFGVPSNARDQRTATRPDLRQNQEAII